MSAMAKLTGCLPYSPDSTKEHHFAQKPEIHLSKPLGWEMIGQCTTSADIWSGKSFGYGEPEFPDLLNGPSDRMSCDSPAIRIDIAATSVTIIDCDRRAPKVFWRTLFVKRPSGTLYRPTLENSA